MPESRGDADSAKSASSGSHWSAEAPSCGVRCMRSRGSATHDAKMARRSGGSATSISSSSVQK
eukprot:2729200-Prymnesium_polylepis.2